MEAADRVEMHLLELQEPLCDLVDVLDGHIGGCTCQCVAYRLVWCPIDELHEGVDHSLRICTSAWSDRLRELTMGHLRDPRLWNVDAAGTQGFIRRRFAQRRHVHDVVGRSSVNGLANANHPFATVVEGEWEMDVRAVRDETPLLDVFGIDLAGVTRPQPARPLDDGRKVKLREEVVVLCVRQPLIPPSQYRAYSPSFPSLS